jgi:hypothetical protein
MISEVILRVEDGAVTLTGWGAFIWIWTVVCVVAALNSIARRKS